MYIDTNAGDGECDPCVSGLLQSQYGNLTAQYLTSTVAPSTITGDTLLCTFDFDAMMVYSAWSQNGEKAWLRPLLALNMTELFSIQV